ncbi:MAG: hypothetical protein ACK5LC_17000 [Coprobacillaceae bacterium]
MSIIPSIITNSPLDIIDIYTTEPTFILDLGVIFPVCIMGGILLLKQEKMGYIIPPIMLTFLCVIAVTVVGQSIMQLHYGVVISLQEILGYVVTFIVFGVIALVVNTKFIHKCY